MRFLFLALAILAWVGPAQALTGNTYIHDPSIMVIDGHYASFATGVEGAPDSGSVRTKISPDGLAWEEAGPMPGGLPDWIATELGYTPRNLWAPSVSMHDGIVSLYYSASSFGRNDSAIGLMTNAAFDVTKPTEGWIDQGLVIRSHASDDFNAIDPFRIDTADGRAWLAFGSFWDGIRMIELDPASGKRLDDSAPLAIASRGGGAIEAPAILFHDGFYYLFVSFDRCCAGAASTYRIMVGRSEAVTGPYLDADGKPMLEGGGTELLASHDTMRGPGGQEVFDAGGEPKLVFHYYDRADRGMPKMAIVPLGWSETGWTIIKID